MLDQCTTQHWQVIRVQARLEVAQHHLHFMGLQAENFLEARVVHLIALQVPVPQAQLTGLNRQGQARAALAQGVGGFIQFKRAFSHAHFQLIMGQA